MASRDLLVRVLGDTRDVEAAFARSSRAAATFGASVDTTGKKADRAARSMSSFAKGAAAGFGGAIAFNAGITALRNVIGAASEAQQVLGQTRVALESTGKSWQQYGDRIEDAIASQSRLGFDDEALLRTFSLFIRQSRDVDEAIRRNAIAMNLARARFIDLEQAANLVNKAALGQAGALRRVGIDARNGASGVELLAQLERQFAGAAEDASNQAVGATDRLKVSLENVQEALGALLIPKVTELADVTSNAADKTQVLVDALGRLASVKIPPIRIPLIIDTGGGGLDLGDVFGEAKDAFQRGAETQFPGLKFINDLVKLIEGQPNPNTKAAADAFDAKFDSFLESLEGDIDKSTKRANAKLKAFGQEGFKPLDSNDLGARLQAQFDATLAALDLRFDQAQFAGSNQQALAVLEQTEAVIRQRIATQGRTTDLLRQLFQVEQQRASILADGRDAARKTAEEARELARKQEVAARETMKALTQRNQFRALGLSATGEEIIPGIKNLSTRIDQALQKIGSGEIDVSSKLVDRLKLARKLIAREGQKLTAETRDTINEMIKTVTQGAEKAAKAGESIAPKHVQLSEKIMRALGFDQDEQVKAFRSAQQFAQRAPTFPTGAKPALGTTTTTGGVTITGPVTVVADDPDAFLRELQKKASRTTATARGRFPGRSLGLG